MNVFRRDSVVDSIVSTISDYRSGEVTIDHDHVERWVRQFHAEDQPVILEEMDRILRKYYVPRSQMVAFLRDVLCDKQVIGTDPTAGLESIEFLTIQDRGNSQKNLLEIVDELLVEEYGLSLSESGIYPSTFVYVDDCLFTGNRVKWDIKNWAENAPRGSRLVLVFYAVHMQSIPYVKKEIDPILQERGIKVQLHVQRRLVCDGNAVEVFWPRTLPDDAYVADCVKTTVHRAERKGWPLRLLRPFGMPVTETVFSSPEARDIVESAFLSKGAYIMTLSKNAKEEMRPMGFEKLESLGFGSLFITYRNIANNCPLVLWWGVPKKGPNHPLGLWYPLFLRAGNETVF